MTFVLRKRATPTQFPYDPFFTNYTISFVPGSNATVNGSSSATSFSLTLPQGSLDVQNGTVVEITFTGVDPTASLDGVPNLIAVEGNETEVRVNLDSLSLAEILIRDSTTGNDIALKEPATLSLPLGPNVQASVGDLIEAWSYNETRGIWVQEGFGVVREVDGQLVWVYNASHFSWWNCDRPWTDKSCVDVIVSYRSEIPIVPVVDVSVVLNGVPGSFTYTAQQNTDATGHTCFNFQRGKMAVVSVHSLGRPFYSTQPDPIVGSEEPSVCPGSPDWTDFSQSGSTQKCQTLFISCDCGCLGQLVEGTYHFCLPTLLQQVSNTSQNEVVLNLHDIVRFRASNDCVRKRLLSSQTKTFFRIVSISNDWFTVNDMTGDVETAPDFPSKVEVGLTLNVVFEVILEDEDEATESCLCGMSQLKVPIAFTVVPGKFSFLLWAQFVHNC